MPNTVTYNGKNYILARPTEQQYNSLRSSSPVPEQKVKDIFYHNKDNDKIYPKFEETFPNFKEILANAPKDFKERVIYADRIAKENPNMYLADDVISTLVPNFNEYKRRRTSFPDYIGGNFNTKGTKTNPNVYGVRSALLRPDAAQDWITKENYKKFIFEDDGSGNPKAKLKELYIDEINPDLRGQFNAYKKGGTINYIEKHKI